MLCKYQKFSEIYLPDIISLCSENKQPLQKHGKIHSKKVESLIGVSNALNHSFTKHTGQNMADFVKVQTVLCLF